MTVIGNQYLQRSWDCASTPKTKLLISKHSRECKCYHVIDFGICYALRCVGLVDLRLFPNFCIVGAALMQFLVASQLISCCKDPVLFLNIILQLIFVFVLPFIG